MRPAIAKAILKAREQKSIDTTLELVDVIKGAMPSAALREKQHPAKRSFQAIRIAVNDELGVLPVMLRSAVEHLNPGGRLAVISFHSLEDRIIKDLAGAGHRLHLPAQFPGRRLRQKAEGHAGEPKTHHRLGGGALRHNPRARSAKLRAAEKDFLLTEEKGTACYGCFCAARKK